MPGRAMMNAKRNRGGAFGQSSRFYNIYGKQVSATADGAFKGAQGWGSHNPSIGSLLSMGIMKQNKNAGGNNVCSPSAGPLNAICQAGPSARCPCNTKQN